MATSPRTKDILATDPSCSFGPIKSTLVSPDFVDPLGSNLEAGVTLPAMCSLPDREPVRLRKLLDFGNDPLCPIIGLLNHHRRLRSSAKTIPPRGENPRCP